MQLHYATNSTGFYSNFTTEQESMVYTAVGKESILPADVLFDKAITLCRKNGVKEPSLIDFQKILRNLVARQFLVEIPGEKLKRVVASLSL